MKKILFSALALTMCLSLSADEGMWLIHSIDAALEKKMQERGLELSAKEIYNADTPGASLADAVVSLDFGCTGSIISDNGLLITNHHCAYSDIHTLSTPDHNYLEDGFWAMKSEEEIHIKGKSAFFLKKVIDVTEEVKALQSEMHKCGKPCGPRKMSFILEKKYAKESGLEAMLSSFWSGSKYYMALYEVYKDVRLVAAPPVSMAAFGGDIDNWEWPQHKCDFAMYRIYTDKDGKPADYSEDNIPMKPAKKLEISLDGYNLGDYTMVIGYPGRTNRNASSAEVSFCEKVSLPISTSLRHKQMEIVNEWMKADPAIRLKYSDYYFSLSNVQELGSGQAECFRRFSVASGKTEQDRVLSEWIASNGQRQQELGNLPAELCDKYEDIERVERSKTFFRETLIRGSRIGTTIRKAYNCRRPTGLPNHILNDYDEIDLRVEKDLLIYSLEQYLRNVDKQFISNLQKKFMEEYLHDGEYDYKALGEDLWNNSMFTCEDGIERLKAQNVTKEEIINDPLAAFIMSAQITDFNKLEDKIEGEESVNKLNGEYKRALYRMRLEKGIAQYPDANSTMRVTFGTVCTLEPRDGVICDWKTTPAGILEKYNPTSYEFSLNDRQYLLYRRGDWGRWGFGDDKRMYVDFLTDNDITGGNSGSPVLNAKGELIGLAFDGNKESLASDAAYIADYNRCVCVDIRFILWTLDTYAGMTRIIEEIGL